MSALELLAARFGSGELLWLAAALLMLMLSSLGLLCIGQRETALEERLRAVVDGRQAAPRVRKGNVWAAWWQRAGAAIASSKLIGTKEQEKLGALLDAAGIRAGGRVSAFVAAKLGSLFGGLASAWLLLHLREGDPGDALRLVILAGAALSGWRLPDIVVGRLAARRRLQLERGLPDVLDLLVICAEAGLGLEAAIERVARDIRLSNPVLGAELGTVAAEMRMLADRAQALENLARRVTVDGLRSITSTLIQSIQYGTPLAQSLRVFAAELRSTRALKFEARAARLPVMLTVPMIVFILPALFLIVGGPAVLQIIDTFK